MELFLLYTFVQQVFFQVYSYNLESFLFFFNYTFLSFDY